MPEQNPRISKNRELKKFLKIEQDGLPCPGEVIDDWDVLIG